MFFQFTSYQFTVVWIEHQLLFGTDGACGTYGGEWQNTYRGLVGKPEGKKPFGRPRNR
jgi:hypothetical protein